MTRTYVLYISFDISRSVLIVSLLMFQWSLSLRPGRFPFADAKVLLFSLLPNYFQSFFQENFKYFLIWLIFKELHGEKFSRFFEHFRQHSPISPQTAPKLFLEKCQDELKKLEQIYPNIPKSHYHHRRKICWKLKILKKILDK